MKELFANSSDIQIDYNAVYLSIGEKVKKYLINHKIQSVVIGISGGLDSAVNTIILSDICKEMQIPLIGRYIHIETNKEEEHQRAELIGKTFCDNFESEDLTGLYRSSLLVFEEGEKIKNITYDDKIRRGNIKARLRMIHLYNLAQKNHGIVIDNDNMTENLLGFWTLNGDVGDITPLASLFKTEVYDLARNMAYNLLKRYGEESNEFKSLQNAINAIPTDGLGITSSDLEQFGASSYEEVDDILISYLYDFGYENVLENYLYKKYDQNVVNKIINRHIKSNFKRNHPYKIKLEHQDIFIKKAD